MAVTNPESTGTNSVVQRKGGAMLEREAERAVPEREGIVSQSFGGPSISCVSDAVPSIASCVNAAVTAAITAAVTAAVTATAAPLMDMLDFNLNYEIRKSNTRSQSHPMAFPAAYNCAVWGLAPPASNVHTRYVYAAPAGWTAGGLDAPEGITRGYLERIQHCNSNLDMIDRSNANLIFDAIGAFYGFPVVGARAFPGPEDTTARSAYLLNFLCAAMCPPRKRTVA